MLDGARDIKDGHFVHGSQVHGNIDNCGDSDGDSDNDGNSSSKLESSDHVPCYSINYTNKPSFIEVNQGMCMAFLCLIQKPVIAMVGAGTSGDIAAFGVKAKSGTISEIKDCILHLSVHVN